MTSEKVQSGTIRKRGQNYPIYQFTQETISIIKNECAGVIHGGQLLHLANIMKDGYLLCSDTLRSRNITHSQRDANSIGPDGKGVYFRFVPKNITPELMINSFTGPGKNGGFFFYMPIENMTGLKFLSASIGDYKYSETSAEEISNINNEIGRNIRCGGLNNSEIIFYKELPFTQITEIYIDSCYNKQKGYVYKTYSELYDSIQPPPGFPKEEENRHRNICSKKFIQLLDIKLNRIGYTHVQTISANSTEYFRYVKSPTMNASNTSEKATGDIASAASQPAIKAQRTNQSVSGTHCAASSISASRGKSRLC